MLAYVFWHWRSAAIGREAYEQAIADFHRALRLDPPDGFLESVSLRSGELPFEAAAIAESAYEDWYVVRDWAALGRPNEAAVRGSRGEPHARVAAMSGAGRGGVYARLRATAALSETRRAAWLSKPSGLGYERYRASLCGSAPRAQIWQRQLVLAPAPEFCVLSATATELPPGAASTGDRLSIVD